MKVSKRGQVTIPRELRLKAGLLPGVEVEFIEESGSLCLRKVERSGRGNDLVRRMTNRGDVGMTTDEILALTRGAE